MECGAMASLMPNPIKLKAVLLDTDTIKYSLFEQISFNRFAIRSIADTIMAYIAVLMILNSVFDNDYIFREEQTLFDNN